ncbi:hypothetical protein Cycma_2065 [Cyclobacterium marinum DSM 745]|uniref:Uncharacterized protein n=1 Tax=Cyclobacterium marinum (strain ATCC 25205 / DSM 745 / LMG 13164 / NCIMB 1802) TaxID=880070 RepID=G0J163_CYCMS|nr:hypothetical protein Cycma_2065 [Cyclobacterium marinum DSM 745]
MSLDKLTIHSLVIQQLIIDVLFQLYFVDEGLKYSLN